MTDAELCERKRSLLSSLKNRREPTAHVLEFSVAGVGARIECLGAGAAETASFLRRYLYPFPYEGALDLKLTLVTPAGDEGDPRNPLWNTLSETFEVSHEGDAAQVLQRDFVGWVSPDGGQMVAIVPKLDLTCVDSIDNALMFGLSRHLPKKSALALHAACVERDGAAFVFFGASGAGKSTLAKHCNDTDGLRVLSGDQIYLRLDPKAGLWACPCPTTIWEFPRGHSGWCPEPRPVRALLHLVQRGGFEFRALQPSELLPHFLRETIYHPLFGGSSEVLSQTLSILQSGCRLGEFSYPKGISFWSYLMDHLKA